MLRDVYLRVKDYDFRNRAYFAVCFGIPAILGSVVSFLIAGGVLYGLINIWLRNMFFTRDRSILLVSYFFFAYIFFQLVSSFVNLSIKSDAGDLLSNLTFLSFPILYSFVSVVDKEFIKKSSIAGCAFSCFAGFFIAVFEFYGRDMRAEAAAGNPIVFGMMVGLTAAIALAAAFANRGRYRHLLFAASAAGAVAMFLSGAKIMWIAFAACLVIVLLAYRDKLAFRVTRTKGVVVLCGALAFGGLAFDPIVSRMEHFMHDVATVEAIDANAVSYRLAVWKVGIGAFLEKPIFGHGVSATTGIIERGLDREIGKPLLYTHFHNGFLTALVETGIFGAFSLYGAFVAAACIGVRSLRKAKTETETFGAAFLLVTVATYLVCGMVGILVGHDIIDTMLLLSLVVGIYLAAGKRAYWASELAAPATTA